MTPERVAFLAACTPSWFNAEGRTDVFNGFLASEYPAIGNQFFDMLKEWRENGRYEGVTFERQLARSGG